MELIILLSSSCQDKIQTSCPIVQQDSIIKNNYSLQQVMPALQHYATAVDCNTGVADATSGERLVHISIRAPGEENF